MDDYRLFRRPSGAAWFYSDNSGKVCPFRHLYYISSIKRRVLVFALCILNKLNIFPKNFIAKSNLPEALLDEKRRIGITDDTPFAVFLGSPGIDGKRVWYTEEVGYIKCPTNEYTAEMLKNEYRGYLAFIGQNLHNFLGDVSDLRLDETGFLIVGRKKPSLNRKIEFDYTKNFLGKLSSCDRVTESVVENLPTIPAVSSYFHSLERIKDCLIEVYSDSEVDFHLSHGDFTPWNCYLDKNYNLIVFDLERFKKSDFECIDLVYFELSKQVLLDRNFVRERFIEDITSKVKQVYGKVISSDYLVLLVFVIFVRRLDLIVRSSSFEQQKWFSSACMELLEGYQK